MYCGLQFRLCFFLSVLFCFLLFCSFAGLSYRVLKDSVCSDSVLDVGKAVFLFLPVDGFSSFFFFFPFLHFVLWIDILLQRGDW